MRVCRLHPNPGSEEGWSRVQMFDSSSFFPAINVNDRVSGAKLECLSFCIRANWSWEIREAHSRSGSLLLLRSSPVILNVG